MYTYNCVRTFDFKEETISEINFDIAVSQLFMFQMNLNCSIHFVMREQKNFHIFPKLTPSAQAFVLSTNSKSVSRKMKIHFEL